MATAIQILCLVVGVILLLAGLAEHIVALIVIGIILMAIGGVWLFIWSGDFDL